MISSKITYYEKRTLSPKCVQRYKYRTEKNIWHKNINLYFSLLGGFLSGGFCPRGAFVQGAFVLDPYQCHSTNVLYD